MKKKSGMPVSPMCKNCEHSCWTIDKSMPKGQMRKYVCGDGLYVGIPLYPWDICKGYKKRYHRNKQVDFQDVFESMN